MSKEQNKAEQTVVEQTGVEGVAEPEIKESYMPELFLERRPFVWKGETKYSYVVEANLRGRELKVELSPRDLGGYELIDIVFDGARKLPLVISQNRYKDDFSRVKSSYGYAIRSLDGVLLMPLIPKNKTDGTKLEMLISQSIADKKALEKV